MPFRQTKHLYFLFIALGILDACTKLNTGALSPQLIVATNDNSYRSDQAVSGSAITIPDTALLNCTPVSLQLSNHSNFAISLNLFSVDNPANFTVSSSSGLSLAPQQSLTASITFCPAGLGLQITTLSVGFGNDASSGAIAIAIKGTGIPLPPACQTLAAGQIDTDFGTLGSRHFDFNGSDNTSAGSGKTLKTLSDGTLLLSGKLSNGTYHEGVILKLNSDGSYFNAFGVNGVATVDYGVDVDSVNVETDSSGNIYVSALMTATSKRAVAKLTAAGGLVSGFGSAGFFKDATTGNFAADFISLRPTDNSVFVTGQSNRAGTTQGFDLFATVLNGTSGALLATIGSGGLVNSNYATDEYGRALAWDGTTGGFFLGGNSGTGTDFDMEVVKFDSSGAVVPGYGTAGRTLVSFGSYTDEVNDLLRLSDGSVIAVGYTHGASNGNADQDAAMMKLNSSGGIDTSFGTLGKYVKDFNGKQDSFNSIIPLSNGQFAVVGMASAASGEQNVVIARFTANGNPDPTFGTSGFVQTDFGSGNHDYALTGQLDTAGRLVITGLVSNGANNDILVARYCLGH